MKKRIALFLAALFAFSMVATSAFASDVDTHATCQHTSGTRTEKQTAYVEYTNEYHQIFLTEVYYCNSCNAMVGMSQPEYLGTGAHTHGSGHYEYSVHEGKYLMHYYVYSGTCTICNGDITWNENGGCTADACVDPMCL